MVQSPLSERDLLQRAASGDPTAGEELMTRYRGLVAAAARRVLASSVDIDDIVQETMLALLTNAANIREPNCLGAWLWTTAGNLARRTARRNARLWPMAEVELGAWADPEQAEDLERVAEREESYRALHAALGSISPHERQLIGLLVGADRPCYATISATMDRPMGSLGPTRHRILDKLRRHPAMARLGAA